MKIGDHVSVKDEGLEKLTSILAQYGMEPDIPNNVGIIDDIVGDMAYIIFDDSGQCAPYFLSECTVIN